MSFERGQFGPHELEQYRIDLPYNIPRARHPHDSQAMLGHEQVLSRSSTGQHMVVHNAVLRDSGGQMGGRSTQWGSQFDTPHHFLADGATSIDRSIVSGPARVLDLRAPLAGYSDGLAITTDVIRHALDQAFGTGAVWERLLIRTLPDDLAKSKVALARFPYFETTEAVGTLLDTIRERTGVRVKVVFNEPPSVDEVNQGHLATPAPDGNGGAHGAFHQQGVVIGENWDFRGLRGGDRGVVTVFFDSAMHQSPDSVLASGAYFFPEDVVEQVRNSLVPTMTIPAARVAS